MTACPGDPLRHPGRALRRASVPHLSATSRRNGVHRHRELRTAASSVRRGGHRRRAAGDGPCRQTATVHITDTYNIAPGSLLVRKTIAGPAAGRQGPITIHTECNGTALTPDFDDPRRRAAGDRSMQYDHIPAPTTCTVTETADGRPARCRSSSRGRADGERWPGDIVQADIGDTYGLMLGELEVTKTIDGPAAGSQGQVVVQTVCNGTALTPDFVIPAGTPAGDQSHLYSGHPHAGRLCRYRDHKRTHQYRVGRRHW